MDSPAVARKRRSGQPPHDRIVDHRQSDCCPIPPTREQHDRQQRHHARDHQPPHPAGADVTGQRRRFARRSTPTPAPLGGGLIGRGGQRSAARILLEWNVHGAPNTDGLCRPPQCDHLTPVRLTLAIKPPPTSRSGRVLPYRQDTPPRQLPTLPRLHWPAPSHPQRTVIVMRASAQPPWRPVRRRPACVEEASAPPPRLATRRRDQNCDPARRLMDSSSPCRRNARSGPNAGSRVTTAVSAVRQVALRDYWC
jgi:hypothetical protein